MLTGESHSARAQALLLFGCGVVTAAPMMLYPNGAKLVRLPIVRVLQCIAPTLIFFYAVQVFGEPFDRSRRIAFPLIWAVLVLYLLGL